jgi:low affinity Fe/Cu permease
MVTLTGATSYEIFERNEMNDIFNRFAGTVSLGVGHPLAFLSAVAMILVWAAFGPAVNYSTAWIYWLTLSTGIATFLMTFVIVNTQNRDSLAAQLKLDELIRAVSGASNAMINVEGLNDQQLADLRAKLAELAKTARENGEAIIEEIENGRP